MQSPTVVSTRTQSRFVPSERGGVDKTIALPLLVVHLVGIGLAPFTFSVAGAVMLVGFYLFSGLGVTAGAHRYFTHHAFRCTPFFRKLLSLMFLTSAQGSLSRWVRDHHIHHVFSDRPGDPHTPHRGHGFWYAQLFWLWKKPPSPEENKQLYQKYAGGMQEDSFIRFFTDGTRLFLLHGCVLLLIYLAGCAFESGLTADFLFTGWRTGVSCVVWGYFLRIVLVLHATSLVNSATHLWGYRNYETREESRNNWWVALLSLGEGWHNNHHSRPVAANQGFHRWWEFDLTFCFLLGAACMGLVSDLRVYRRKREVTEIWFKRNHEK